mgnify:CR=1 FL=1
MTAYNTKTTLRRIREGSPESGRACEEGWKKLLTHVGKTKADDEPIDVLTVLDSNGLDDALWVISYAMPDDRLNRHVAAWCAERSLHLFEAKYPNDDLRPDGGGVTMGAQIQIVNIPVDDLQRMIRAAVREEIGKAKEKPEPGWLTVAQAAVQNQCSPATINRWVKSGAWVAKGAGKSRRVREA